MHSRLACCLLGFGIVLGMARAQDTETLSESQIREFVRMATDKDIENTKRQRNYTYVQRNEEHELDGKGQVKKTESKTFEIMVLGGEPVQRLVAKNDKPLPEKEAKKEEERIQDIIEKYQKESEKDRRKRLEKADKEAEEGRQFVREVADAYNFRYSGSEILDGRLAYIIDADPKPGYKPKLKDARFLPKVRFRAWLDKAEQQWVKLDVECIDTISFGLFLARIRKGSRIQIEQTRVNDEVWLPKQVGLKLDARVVFKGVNRLFDVAFRDYKKFQTEITIIPDQALR